MSPQRIACPSCAAYIDAEYCAKCGERRPREHDVTPGHLAEQTFEGLTHLDAKFPRSAWLLLAKPGFLAAEFARGARRNYVRPATLFLVANGAYYLLQPLTGANSFRTNFALLPQQPLHRGIAKRWVEAKLAATGMDIETYAARYDARSDSLSKLLLFVFIPAIAAVVAMLHRRRRRPFGEHLVFSLHFKAFVLSYVCLVLMPLEIAVQHAVAPYHEGDGVTSLVTLAAIATYLAFAFRRFYRDTWSAATLRAIAAAFSYALLLAAYRAALFFVTFWTT